jgi:hypothetical protein
VPGRKLANLRRNPRRHSALRELQPREETMTTFYVATIAQYVLVEAANEEDARLRGHEALRALDPRRTAPIRIGIIRPATADEIELQRWHQQALDAEPGCEFCRQEVNRSTGEFTCPYCNQDW